MTPKNSTATPTLQPPKSGIKVRMYNPGFGDCFLLAFRAEDGSARYMLIDCGVHHQYRTEQIPDREKRMQLLAKDIAKATANHLHVVVVTHEHTDHLYGFNYGKDIFDAIDIDDLWLAWTEDPTDPIAKQLKRLYGMRITALAAFVNRLRLSNAPLASALQNVLDFESPDALAATAGKATQLDYLRTKSRKKLRKTEDYRHPGEAPLTLPGVKGVKVYVLGPPNDTDLIKSLKKESELYRKLTAMNEVAAFTAAAPAAAGTDSLEDEDFRRSRPFDEFLEISKDDAGSHSEYGRFFQKHYGFQEQREHGPEWRRIDTDWLAAAEQLALNINSYTNNTSLVLAIELTEVQPRKVLLFAADAQVGNWLSWRKWSWPGEGEGGETVTVKYLLQRTALYKAGHHGSRNATLSKNGLEMMDSANLVVMLPVDEDWAYNKMGWEHPAEKLLDRLKEKALGRIIRTDEIPSSHKPPGKPGEATESEWQAFIAQLDWDRSQDKLWIQYTLPG